MSSPLAAPSEPIVLTGERAGCAADDAGRVSSITDRSPSARRVALAEPQERSQLAGTSGSGPLDLGTLVDIATGLASAEGLWRPHVSHDPVSRTSVRLVATPVYEVWLLGWTPGQHVELHDHGASNAAFVVVDGELDELTLRPSGLDRGRFTTGGVGTVSAGTVHDVLNPGTEAATSIHVYADPLRTMTFYEADGTPRFSEIVQEVPALISSGTTARVLHPGSAR